MVLTLLVAAPAAMAGTRADIVKDCFDDGKLDGNYTASQIRDARNNLPADVDQYSDCRDVLARALGGSGSNDIGAAGAGAPAVAAAGPASRSSRAARRSRERSTRPRRTAATTPSRSARARSCRARPAWPPARRATTSPPACSWSWSCSASRRWRPPRPYTRRTVIPFVRQRVRGRRLA